VKAILEVDAESALIRNALGYTPLHIAVEEGNLAILMTITGKINSCARVQCEEGFLPIHYSVSTGARHPDAPQITTILLQAFEDSVNVTTDEGLLPTHLAAMSGFTAGLRTLLSTKIDTIKMRESTENMLPLDFAVEGYKNESDDKESSGADDDETQSMKLTDEKKGSNIDTNISFISSIELILSSTLYNRVVPRPREAANDFTFLPLHSAVISRPTLDSWKTIMSIYSDSHLSDVDPRHRNPTHLICSYLGNNDSTDPEIDLFMLRSMHKDSFLTPDEFGFLPLHYALVNKGISFNLINEIVKKQPRVVGKVINDTSTHVYANFLPVHVAAAENCDLNIIYSLMKEFPYNSYETKSTNS